MYFIYPETCGVRLEEMDSIFGDASTMAGTPSMRAESGLLMPSGSPIGSPYGNAASSHSIPGLSLDSDVMDEDDRKRRNTGGEDRTVSGWLSRVVGRDRSNSPSSRQGRYAPVGSSDNRNNG